MPRRTSTRANKNRDPDGTILPPGIRYRERDSKYVVECWTPKYAYGGAYPTLAKALNALTAAQKRADGKGQLPEVEDWITVKKPANQSERLTDSQLADLNAIPTKATRMVRIEQRQER